MGYIPSTKSIRTCTKSDMERKDGSGSPTLFVRYRFSTRCTGGSFLLFWLNMQRVFVESMLSASSTRNERRCRYLACLGSDSMTFLTFLRWFPSRMELVHAALQARMPPLP